MDAAGPSSSSARPPSPTFLDAPTPTVPELPPFLVRDDGVRHFSISPPPPPPRWPNPRRHAHRTRNRVPAPVVVNVDHREDDALEEPDPERDLWLSTADGRFSSPMIAIRVGQIPNIQTFYVHRTVLLKAKWFERALCSGFRETASQEIDLPEENPAIFHFVIAFLYENRYVPIQAASSVLEPEPDKGKGKEDGSEAAADDDSETSSISRASSDSMMRDSIRVSLEMPRVTTKERGVHRVDCRCNRCTNDRHRSRQCLQCGAFAEDDPPTTSGRRSTRHIRNRPLWLHENLAETVSQPSVRIPPEDLRTWLMVYELNLDVYICAVRLLMDDLQKAVMRSTVDMLETAGTEAAQVKVLQLCAKLHAGVPETDSLLNMILARVGFLQSLLWQKAPAETSEFLVGNPELAAMMLRETSRRHENEDQYRILPAMELNAPPTGTMVRYAGRPPHGFMA